jgi:peptide/nickel transport system substrate-binding protein
MTNSPLSLRDPRGDVSPLLAADLPSRVAGTWVVNPDGTMRTTWRIRPNAIWHDGTPITPRDFAFALQVYMDPTMPVANRVPEQFMERVEALDDRTFVIYWKQSYPRANELGARDLEPLPEHIVGPMYRQLDPDALGGHPFWSSTDYVGSGPYVLVRWDPGTQLVFRAFDRYFMGRAKIDEIVFRIIPDTNTLVANLLAGEVDTAIGATALGQQAGANVKEQWSRTGEGEVFITPVRFRHTQIQFDRAYLEQPALLDLRVRRAIAHAWDRESLAEIVTAGLSRATEIFLSPNDPLYARAHQAIARYAYDPSRAAALLQEAGWTKRGETLVHASGEPFKLDIRSTQGADNQAELSIQAADLAKLGMQISQAMVPNSRIRDSEYRIKFPGLNNTALSIDVPDTLRRGVSAECPDPNRRYTGGNRGCWTNPEFDRLYDVAASSLDAAERARALVQALKILTEDLGIIGLSYTSENIPVRKGLIGPGPRWPGQVGNTWNVHEWHWKG